MKNLEHGGPAFPLHEAMSMEPGNVDEHKRLMAGMTLRDYFAAKAMESVIGTTRSGGWSIGIGGNDNAHIAEISYSLADAMIAERCQ